MSREAFKKWAEENLEWNPKRGEPIYDATALAAWEAGIKYISNRPTTPNRLDSKEFRKDNPETLVDRLNGIYPVPVPGQYNTSPLHKEAAREIERLRVENKGLAELFRKKVDDYAELNVGTHREIERLKQELRQHKA